MTLTAIVFLYWVVGLCLNAKALPARLAKTGLYPSSTFERIAMVALIMIAAWIWPIGTLEAAGHDVE